MYYTPTYIVDYIVQPHRGRAAGGQTTRREGRWQGRHRCACWTRPAVPARFLLGAYQYLLDWYRDGYVALGAEKWAKGKQPALYQGTAASGS